MRLDLEAIETRIIHTPSIPQLREDVFTLLVKVKQLRDTLTDLVDYTDRHRLSYDDHNHDCYQEWALLRDEARLLLTKLGA